MSESFKLMGLDQESSRGAFDLSTGFSADSFISNQKTGKERERILDPWHKMCFITLTNVVINYKEVRFPLPNPLLEYKEHDLPESMRLLNAAQVLYHYSPAFAGVLKDEITETEIRYEFENFSNWATSKEADNPKNLLEWLERQVEIGRLGMAVPDYIHRFWYNYHFEVLRLAEEIHKAGNQYSKHHYSTHEFSEALKYAFSVMFRGLEYCALFGPDTRYFRHPLKQSLFRHQERDEPFISHNKWSWGDILADDINQGRIERDYQRVIDYVLCLREHMQAHNATWDDLGGKLPDKEMLERVATDCKLPGRLEKRWIEIIRGAPEVGSTISGALGAPWVSVILATGSIATKFFFKGNIPGGAVKYIRAFVEWPGINRQLDEKQRTSRPD